MIERYMTSKSWSNRSYDVNIILSQKVPKFELYKHNDELFNIYYGIFYELWTSTDYAN